MEHISAPLTRALNGLIKCHRCEALYRPGNWWAVWPSPDKLDMLKEPAE